MKRNTLKVIIFILVPVVLIALWYAVRRYYMKKYPGLIFKYKCDQNGDDSSKFYGDNWKARGFVCDGGYIPFGVKLKNKDVAKILEKMSELNNGKVPASKKEMKELAKKAVEQA